MASDTVSILDEVSQLDFAMIKRKLQDPDEGAGWDAETCDVVETEYLRFLALKKLYPEADIVPNHQVDTFWHYHILDTRKYAEDCETYFGEFIHHYPYFGMNGAEDEQALEDAFDETKALYARHFGESYDAGAARCRTACKPQKCR